MFRRYSLRTLDADAARAFYHEVVALDFAVPVEASGIEAWPLHERARARGATPHWLGHAAVADLDATLNRLLALGAERLGPSVVGRDGVAFTVLRDPFGAIVALRESTPPLERAPVAWHHLHTRDLERAVEIYPDLLGWKDTGTIEAAGPFPNLEGGFRTFSDGSAGSAGSIANTARWPGVHTHWLFYFPVADLDASLALVRAKGGKTLEPIVLPNGDRLAPCDDPQGAAFGLFATGR